MKNRPESPPLANLISFTFTYKLHWEKLIVERDGKGSSDDLLSFAPAIGTLLSPSLVMVVDETCTYFDGVWSKLMIKEDGIWYS